MGMWVLEECLREWSVNGERPTYDVLMADAARAASADGTLDLNAAEFGERGHMVDKLEAVCRARGIRMPPDRGALVRLMLESLADSYARTLDELTVLTGRRVEIVHIVGGGARNELLNQLTANACGRTVLAGPSEAAVLGNLLVQARTVGALPAGVSVREAARRTGTTTRYLACRSEYGPSQRSHSSSLTS